MTGNPSAAARPGPPPGGDVAGHPAAGQPDPPPGGELAARQAALVAALVAGGDPPPGFDTRRLAATRSALLRKRAGEVARQWPLLAAGLGDQWPAAFVRWADGRPTRGALRDGWDFARTLRADGALPSLAAGELAVREATSRYDGERPPRRRRLPAVVRVGDAVVVQIAGRVRTRW